MLQMYIFVHHKLIFHFCVTHNTTTWQMNNSVYLSECIEDKKKLDSIIVSMEFAMRCGMSSWKFSPNHSYSLIYVYRISIDIIPKKIFLLLHLESWNFSWISAFYFQKERLQIDYYPLYCISLAIVIDQNFPVQCNNFYVFF